MRTAKLGASLFLAAAAITAPAQAMILLDGLTVSEVTIDPQLASSPEDMVVILFERTQTARNFNEGVVSIISPEPIFFTFASPTPPPVEVSVQQPAAASALELVTPTGAEVVASTPVVAQITPEVDDVEILETPLPAAAPLMLFGLAGLRLLQRRR